MPARTCLVVDDEPAIRSYLIAILQDQAFQALEAENAPQAFKLIQKLNGCVDLVVTDVQMHGDMDGEDLAFAIRQAFPSIPVVLISGYGPPKNRTTEFEFIEKPFKPEAILTMIRKLVGLAAKQQAAS